MQDYDEVLDNLISNTDEWLFISTWSCNPFKSLRKMCLDAMICEGIGTKLSRFARIPSQYHDAIAANRTSDGVYQIYRPVEKEVKRFESRGLHLEAVHLCPWNGFVSCLYVFHRRDSDSS